MHKMSAIIPDVRFFVEAQCPESSALLILIFAFIKHRLASIFIFNISLIYENGRLIETMTLGKLHGGVLFKLNVIADRPEYGPKLTRSKWHIRSDFQISIINKEFSVFIGIFDIWLLGCCPQDERDNY